MSQSVIAIAVAAGYRAFIPAFEDLMGQIEMRRSLEILRCMSEHAKALKRGSCTPLPIEVEAAGALALLHVSTGTPLYMNDALLDSWALSDGSCEECEIDGYRQPAGFSPKCVLCGGAMLEPGAVWTKSGLPAAKANDLRLLTSTACDLAKQLSPDRAVRLLRDINNGLRAVLAGRQIPESMVAGAALVIAHQFLSLRTPLHLTDELFDRWAAAEHAGASECSRCGYRMPEDFAECVLCGARTGAPGIFARTRKRMASKAGMN